MKKLLILLCVFGVLSACNNAPQEQKETDGNTQQANIAEPKNTYKAPATLFDAIYNGDIEGVRNLIAKGADVNAKDELGANALIWALWPVSPIEAAKEIRSRKCDIFTSEEDIDKKYKDYPQTIPPEKRAEIVKLLIAAGADLNEKDKYIGKTPLIYAVTANDKEVVKLLLESGADINAKVNNTTPLFTAVENRYTEIAKFLIESGADKNAMLQVTILGKLSIAGRPSEYFDCSILHIMLLEQDEVKYRLAPKDMPEYLDHGKSREKYPREHLYPSEYFDHWKSREKNLPEIIKLLQDSGAQDIRKKVSYTENTSDRRKPRAVAVPQVPQIIKEVQEANTENVKNLLEEEKNNRNSALLLAAKNGNIEIAKLLIAAGADVNARLEVDVHESAHIPPAPNEMKTNCLIIQEIRKSDTPLLAAAINGKVEMLKFLISAKADVNIVLERVKSVCDRCMDPVGCHDTKYGETLLNYLFEHNKDSAIADYSDIVKILEDAGAKQNLQICDKEHISRYRNTITFLYEVLSEKHLEGVTLYFYKRL